MRTAYQRAFAMQLRERRNELNMTVNQCVEIFNALSEWKNTTVETWRQWESTTDARNRQPSIGHFPVLARVLQLDCPGDLLPRIKTRKPPKALLKLAKVTA